MRNRRGFALLIFDKRKKQFARNVVIGLILVAMPLNFSTSLVCFTLGVMLLPRALRRYRESQQREKSAWYRRPDLMFCLYGLLCGPLAVLSFWWQWMKLVAANALLFGDKTWIVLLVGGAVLSLVVIMPVKGFVYEIVRPDKLSKQES